MKYLAGTGSIIKRSRAHYVTVPKEILLKMGLKKGDRVKVEYNKFYNQMIVSKEDRANGRLPVKHQGA